MGKGMRCFFGAGNDAERKSGKIYQISKEVLDFSPIHPYKKGIWIKNSTFKE